MKWNQSCYFYKGAELFAQRPIFWAILATLSVGQTCDKQATLESLFQPYNIQQKHCFCDHVEINITARKNTLEDHSIPIRV
jgi:hypothetical protein